MNIIWITMVGVGIAFYLGCVIGTRIERMNYDISENKQCIVYQGEVYMKLDDTPLNNYLTAMGKKGK